MIHKKTIRKQESTRRLKKKYNYYSELYKTIIKKTASILLLRQPHDNLYLIINSLYAKITLYCVFCIFN